MNQSSSLPRTVLIVDHDASLLATLEPLLRKNGIKATQATSVEMALDLFARENFGAVMVDASFTPVSGLVLIQKWRASVIRDKRATGFVLMTGKGRSSTDEGLLRELADIEILTKPISVGGVLTKLSRAMSSHAERIRRQDIFEKIRGMADDGASEDRVRAAVSRVLAGFGAQGVELVMDIFVPNGWLASARELVDLLAAKLDAPVLQVVNARARLELLSGDKEAALRTFEEVDRLAPSNLERMHKMVDLYLQLQQPDPAVEMMKDLIKLSPENPELKFDFFSRLISGGFDVHAKELAHVVASATEVIRHYNNKGVALSRHGFKEKAVDSYLAAIAFFPAFREIFKIHFNLALSHASDGTPEGVEAAIRELGKSLDVNPAYIKASELKERLSRPGAGGGLRGRHAESTNPDNKTTQQTPSASSETDWGSLYTRGVAETRPTPGTSEGTSGGSSPGTDDGEFEQIVKDADSALRKTVSSTHFDDDLESDFDVGAISIDIKTAV